MDPRYLNDLIVAPDLNAERMIVWLGLCFVGEWSVGLWLGPVLGVAILLWLDASS